LDALRLEQLYWDETRRVTFGLARFSRGSIRFVGVWPVIVRFGPLVGGRRAVAAPRHAGEGGRRPSARGRTSHPDRGSRRSDLEAPRRATNDVRRSDRIGAPRARLTGLMTFRRVDRVRW